MLLLAATLGLGVGAAFGVGVEVVGLQTYIDERDEGDEDRELLEVDVEVVSGHGDKI